MASVPAYTSIPARTQVLFQALAVFAEEMTSPQALATAEGEICALALLQGMRGYFLILVGHRWSREEEELLRMAFGLDNLIGPGPFPLRGSPSFPFNTLLHETHLFQEMVARVLSTLRDAIPIPGWEPLVLRHTLAVSNAQNLDELHGLDPSLKRDRARVKAYDIYERSFGTTGYLTST